MMQRGSMITADFLNEVTAALVRCIRGGPGVFVQHSGNNLIISSASSGGANGGGRRGRQGNPGADYVIRVVSQLPPVPTEGQDSVFWLLGDNQDQIWDAFAGQPEWTPRQKLTTRSGIPL